MARIRFGGPRLPEGSHTLYWHTNPDGTFVGIISVYPGDTVDESVVLDAQQYIDKGMATRVADDAAVAAQGD